MVICLLVLIKYTDIKGMSHNKTVYQLFHFKGVFAQNAFEVLQFHILGLDATYSSTLLDGCMLRF